MRPAATQQSAVRKPLNNILGTEANVRILRVLCERQVPISAAELARHAQLQRSTVSRALKSLEQSRIVEYVGVAPQAQIVLRQQNLLARAIRQLFEMERKRFDLLIEGLRQCTERLTPPPYAVWIGGPAATGTDQAGDPTDVHVLDTPERVASTADTLRAEAERLEKKLDIVIAVHEMTFADLATPGVADSELADAIVVSGVPPLGLRARVAEQPAGGTTSRIRSHQDHDARLLARARDIAESIRKDPAIIERARDIVDKRWRTASPGERKELAEWRRILRTASPVAVRRILTASDARSTRLRQTLPFPGVRKRQ